MRLCVSTVYVYACECVCLRLTMQAVSKGLKLLLARPQQQDEARTDPLGVGGVGGGSGGGRASSARNKDKRGKSQREETLGEWQQRVEGKLDDMSEKLERLLHNSPTTTPGSTSWRVSVCLCVAETDVCPVPWLANPSPLSSCQCLSLSLSLYIATT